YIPGPEHADDEIVAEDQPYAEDASPILLMEETTVMTRRSHQRMRRMMRWM
nr:hypothetical protein [Tanacetum cinerariifolium]